MRILLVEDDRSLGATVKSWLELDGYTVDWLTRGDFAVPALDAHDYDCLLLDRGLPATSGDEILVSLRASGSPTPVLILSAMHETEDKIHGLDLGADDYLPKPFDLNELSARLRAILRRRSAPATRVLTYGDLSLDTLSKRFSCRGQTVDLTAKEIAIVGLFLRRPGAIISRAQLEEALYGWDDPIESNTMEVHIYNIRRKIGPGWIKTLRGQGYRLGD